VYAESRKTQIDLALVAFRRDVRGFAEQLERLSVRAETGKFLLTEKTMLRHVLLLGSTGSGKTNHVFDIISKVKGANSGLSCFPRWEEGIQTTCGNPGGRNRSSVDRSRAKVPIQSTPSSQRRYRALGQSFR